ncbi:MAG TPA: OmpA family protein [Pseudomonas sp.]|nr:OmpA family protein [Pseudomonas sp.]
MLANNKSISLSLVLCLMLAGCAGSEKAKKAAAVAMPPPAVTKAWLDDFEPHLVEAIKGSHFVLERRENLLVVTAPVQGSFNPDRPHMLLPVTLGPITRIAKLLEADTSIAAVVLGHADSSGEVESNRDLSYQRARAFTSIFRLSGLKQNRLVVKGLGSDMPRAANDSAEGRALNRRVEILLTSQDTMKALVAKYSQPAPATELAAVKQVVVVDQAK